MRVFLGMIFGAMLSLLTLEAVFSFLPVTSGLRLAPTSRDIHFTHALPDQSYMYSHGWALANARSGRVNHQGYNNSANFESFGKALIVGDSYIESFMLPYVESVQGQLDHRLHGGIYAAAASGNGLADSLEISRYYAPRIKPRHIVLFVEENDLDGLLAPPARGHSSFSLREGRVLLVNESYTESASKEWLLKSALGRYLYYNLKAKDLLTSKGAEGLVVQAKDRGAFRAQRDLALDFYLDQLTALHKVHGVRFVFLVDGDRKAIYDRKKQNWQGDDRDVFIRKAREQGFHVVDMQPVFEQHWARYNERLDFLPIDGHWNAVAHRLAAEQLQVILEPEVKNH